MTIERIVAAERAVVNAQRNVVRAGRALTARRISKSCHRDAVEVLRAAEAHLRDLRNEATS